MIIGVTYPNPPVLLDPGKADVPDIVRHLWRGLVDRCYRAEEARLLAEGRGGEAAWLRREFDELNDEFDNALYDLETIRALAEEEDDDDD